MDLIPKEAQVPAELEERYAELGPYLHGEVAELRRIAKEAKRNAPKTRKAKIVAALEESFELIGGVPRLAIWADQNPTEYYKLLGKTIPNGAAALHVNASGPVQIVCPIGRSSLDDAPELTADGLINVTPEKD